MSITPKISTTFSSCELRGAKILILLLLRLVLIQLDPMLPLDHFLLKLNPADALVSKVWSGLDRSRNHVQVWEGLVS